MPFGCVVGGCHKALKYYSVPTDKKTKTEMNKSGEFTTKELQVESE